MARLHAPLTVKVVNADPGVLDTAEGPLRVEVKLATECGGNFETHARASPCSTRRSSPQPAAGRAYSGGASGSGRPGAYGVQTVCMYLEDTDVGPGVRQRRVDHGRRLPAVHHGRASLRPAARVPASAPSASCAALTAARPSAGASAGWWPSVSGP